MIIYHVPSIFILFFKISNTYQDIDLAIQKPPPKRNLNELTGYG